MRCVVNPWVCDTVRLRCASLAARSDWRMELPYDDGPYEIVNRRGLLNDFVCRQAEAGKLYSKRLVSGVEID